MDLIGVWSKRQDLADLLRRARHRLGESGQWAAKDPLPRIRTTAKAAAPRRVVDRLGEDVVREMIEARAAGLKLREVAERYGISESSVKRILSRRHASSGQ